jgi:hypothetical protein
MRGRSLNKALGFAISQAATPSTQLNGGERYVDRIKRDYRLPEYADALTMYASDPAYWERYYNPPPGGPTGKETFVRDSAVRAAVPSRYNVFEYEFPEPNPAPIAANRPPSPVRSGSWRDAFVRDSAAAAGVPSRYNAFEYGFPEPGGAAPSTIPSGEVWKNMPLPDLAPPPRNPTWNDAFVRDSAAAAGVPSRNNVFEYGFPEPGTAQPLTTPGATRGTGFVGRAVAPPIPYIRAAPQSAPGGLPGLLIEAGPSDPLNPDAPPAGGLVGLIREYLRDNSRGSN